MKKSLWGTLAIFLMMIGTIVAGQFYQNARAKELEKQNSSLTVKIDQESAVDESDQTTSAPKKVNYVAIGDSVTMGKYASTETKSFTKKVATQLAAQDYQVSLTIVGQRGATLANNATKAITKITSETNLVTIEYGTNDAMSDDVSKYVPAEQFGKALTSLIGKIKAKTSAQIIVLTTWNMGADGADYDQQIKLVALKQDIKVVNLKPIWSSTKNIGPAGKTTYLTAKGEGTSDDFHPNDLGHAAIATAIVKEISLPK